MTGMSANFWSKRTNYNRPHTGRHWANRPNKKPPYRGPRDHANAMVNDYSGYGHCHNRFHTSGQAKMLSIGQLKTMVSPWLSEPQPIPADRLQGQGHDRGENLFVSHNAEFGQQVHRLDKAIRLSHATQFWKPIPISVDKLLNRCEKVIRPPGFDKTYSEKLSGIFVSLKNQIHSLTREHLDAHFQTKMSEFATGDQRDLQQIVEKAKIAAKRRTRITDTTITKVIEQIKTDTRQNNQPARSWAAMVDNTDSRPNNQPTRSWAAVVENSTNTQRSKEQGTASHNNQTVIDIIPDTQNAGTSGFTVPKRTAKIPTPQHGDGNPAVTTNMFSALAGENLDDTLTESEILNMLDDTVEPQSPCGNTSGDSGIIPPTPSANRKRKQSGDGQTTRTKTFVQKESAQTNDIGNEETRITKQKTPPRDTWRSSELTTGEDNHGTPTRAPSEESATLPHTEQSGQQGPITDDDDIICTGQTPAPNPGANAQGTTNSMPPPKGGRTSSDATRQRSLSNTNQKGITDLSRPILHVSTDKRKWSITNVEAYRKFVIIADSNAKTWFGCSPDWAVHSFPGAHLEHVLQILEKSTFPSNITSVVVAAGINDRDELPLTVMSTMKKIKKTLDEKHSLQSFFLMVPQLPTFTQMESSLISQLNRTARDIWTPANFIPCPGSSQIKGTHPDDHAHYSASTGAQICTRLHKYLKEVK